MGYVGRLFNGKTLRQWSEETGIKYETLKYRIHKGWTIEDAISVKVGFTKRELSGEKYNRLLVQYKIPNTSKWHCLCDCGNECNVDQNNILSGRQKSCGCLNDENRRAKHKDKSGCVINGVKLLRRVHNDADERYIHYICECPFCHSEFEARINNIASGNTKGCGCTRHQYTHWIDLTGQDFELCHVLRRVENHVQPNGAEKVMYECQCVCGKTYIDWAHTIAHGRSNCGCKRIKSKGEKEIEKWLNNKQISFSPQYWFDDLRGDKNKPLYFDFAILDNEENVLALVEYQGEQHYHSMGCKSIKNFGKRQREVTDPMKKAYCLSNDLLLWEISYQDNIEQKCEMLLNLLYHDNTVPSKQETA